MPQGRIILKRICQSRKLADLKTDGARLLYTWLIPNVDINGCFSGDPEVIKGQVFTRLKKSAKTIAGYMDDLESAGLIVQYDANGDLFIQIPDFVEKQPSLNPDREGKTAIPPPSQELLRSMSGGAQTQVKVSKGKGKSKVKVSKGKYGEFARLTPDEHTKLIDKFGNARTADWIEDLNGYLGSTGKKYDSHYLTILNWNRKREREGITKGQHTGQAAAGRQSRSPRKNRDYNNQVSGVGDSIDTSE